MNQSILDFYGSMSEFELADLQASVWDGMMGTVVEINYAMLGSDQSLMRVLLVAVLIVAWIISVVFMQQSRK